MSSYPVITTRRNNKFVPRNWTLLNDELYTKEYGNPSSWSLQMVKSEPFDASMELASFSEVNSTFMELKDVDTGIIYPTFYIRPRHVEIVENLDHGNYIYGKWEVKARGGYYGIEYIS